MFRASAIAHTVWNMTGRDKLPGRIAMTALVVEENIGAEGFKKLALVHAAQKVALVNPDIPRS